MEEHERDRERPVIVQNTASSPTQLSFNDHLFENYAFEGAELWTFQEGLFDIPNDELPALSVSDFDDLTNSIPNEVYDGSDIAQNAHHQPAIQGIGEREPDGGDEGYEDQAGLMDGLESVGASRCTS
jgi:hypothetical protein